MKGIKFFLTSIILVAGMLVTTQVKARTLTTFFMTQYETDSFCTAKDCANTIIVPYYKIYELYIVNFLVVGKESHDLQSEQIPNIYKVLDKCYTQGVVCVKVGRKGTGDFVISYYTYTPPNPAPEPIPKPPKKEDDR